MKRAAVDLWHHRCTDMKTNNSLEDYNFRRLNRFGLYSSMRELLHYLKYEEVLVSHRISYLGDGGGIISSTLINTHMQSKSKAKETEKLLIRLQDLHCSNFIGLKQYLTSVSLMVGKIPGQNTNVRSIDRIDANIHSFVNEVTVD